MRFNGLVILASALAIGACAGGDTATQDTTTTGTTPAAGADTAAAAGGATGTATAAPITGTTHEVKMIGDAQGYRFEPANITVKQGDGIKWVMVSGGPHNVSFEPANIPAEGRAQLAANMPDQQGELTSPMYMNPGESYTVSFANVAPGAYNYNCVPHLAMNMRGVVTVQQ